ncbi:MAG: aspartate aminotransferase family protein [Kiritimatiellales bacterium]
MKTTQSSHLSSVWTCACDQTVVRGQGCRLYTDTGKSLLDFTSGIGVTSTGHSHPKVAAAIAEQAQKLIFSQINCARHNVVSELAEELATVVPPHLNRFFFAQSGSEAIEAAVKLAKHATGRANIIVMQGSFHGRTHLAMAMTTSKTVYRLKYPNLPAGIYVTPYPYAFASGRSEADETAAALAGLDLVLATQSAPEETAAIVVEPVLGEGGYLPAAPGFLKGLRDICDQHGILLVVDEVQTGCGRTGKMFAHEYDGIEPDIMPIAKGMGSGAPISGIACREELDAKWIKGTHGGTYGGSPLGCAAAVATLRVIKEEGLVANAYARGEQLMNGLRGLQKKFPMIGDVRGRGLMIGIEIMDGSKPDTVLPGKIIREVYARDMMLLSCGLRRNVVRWIPPLIVSEAEIKEGLDIFEAAMEAATCS